MFFFFGFFLLYSPPPHIQATSAGVRLNAKKIYRADGHALQEVLKVVAVLRCAISAQIVRFYFKKCFIYLFIL
jgi:hypothetical protein